MFRCCSITSPFITLIIMILGLFHHIIQNVKPFSQLSDTVSYRLKINGYKFLGLQMFSSHASLLWRMYLCRESQFCWEKVALFVVLGVSRLYAGHKSLVEATWTWIHLFPFPLLIEISECCPCRVLHSSHLSLSLLLRHSSHSFFFQDFPILDIFSLLYGKSR